VADRLRTHRPTLQSGGSELHERKCTRCHGAKVTGKKRWTCKLCGGTGVQSIPKQRQFEIETVLMALRVLTPRSCPEASTKEVSNHIRKVMAMSMTLDAVSRIFVYLERDGLVSKRREGHEALWSLTANYPALQNGAKEKGTSK
jgi:hypothetical protein